MSLPATLAYFSYPDMYSQPTLFTMRILPYFSISSTLMTKASPIDASILTQFLESTMRISREPALDKCLTPLGRYPPPPWFGDLGTMNLSTKLLIASLPAMPATEANTMAIVSSMQLKISGFTTEPVTLLGSDLRTKNMRMKLMIETLGSLVSLIDHGIIYCADREGGCLHCPYEQLYANRDLVVQAHFQIRKPHDRNAEDHDIRDEVCYTCA